MDNKALVNNIKSLCKNNDISISQLEKELYMSPGLISRWVKSTPALDRIVDIANYFNTTIDALVRSSDDEKDNSQLIDTLITTLYNKTTEADIEWFVYDANIAIQESVDIKKMLLPINQENTDFFYCIVNEGGFVFAVRHYSGDDIKLFLYTFADQYSFLELTCDDVDKMTQLYTYLIKRLGKKLNQIKTNNFINNFIYQSNFSENSTVNNDKVTMLPNAVNE